MQKKPDLFTPHVEEAPVREIRVERRFYGARSAGDMLKSLIRAHSDPT